VSEHCLFLDWYMRLSPTWHGDGVGIEEALGHGRQTAGDINYEMPCHFDP
jgi:hypothetical protein